MPRNDNIRLRVLSLGAGVQSTALALMAAPGEIGPMPDCAIFADTGWEPRSVYEHLAWLMSPNRVAISRAPRHGWEPSGQSSGWCPRQTLGIDPSLYPQYDARWYGHPSA